MCVRYKVKKISPKKPTCIDNGDREIEISAPSGRNDSEYNGVDFVKTYKLFVMHGVYFI